MSLDSAITTIRQSRTCLTGKYEDAELNRIPVDDIDRQWRNANSKMWPFSAFERRRIKKLLQSYAAEGKVDVAKEIAPLRNIQCSLAELSINEISKLPIFDNENTVPEKVSQYLNQARALQESLIDIRSCACDISQLGNTLEALFQKQQQPHIVTIAQDFHEKLATFQDAFKVYFSRSGGEPYDQSLDVLELHLQNLIKNKSRLADWAQWVNVREEALNLGLSPYLDALKAGIVDVPKQDFLVAYFNWWLPLAIDACSELRCFRHWSHQDLIKEFQKRDEAVLKLTARQVLAKTSHELPKRDMVSRRSELGTLKHQLSLQRPSASIRNLIESMPTTFTKLAPCMLMSPLSVAQYLPSNQAQFDVIIFDEASQITTWDAVGAIARAQQSVIVGDPKQLPPTNFFGRSDDEDEEDLVEYEKDLPSILEEASAAGLPEIQLNWHYRSRDESLIAFSNWHYYDGRLVTFPSPQTDSHSIIFHKNNGVYARGTGRNNIEEAREIVQFSTNKIMQWMQLPEVDRPTLGVITFNIQQQELILNLFDKARQNDPTLEWYFSDEREEPVIVKNIENIQGDERDIMCFSITFGRDLAGKISMSFGAVNRDGGEKRLNVAVTRARLEMHMLARVQK